MSEVVWVAIGSVAAVLLLAGAVVTWGRGVWRRFSEPKAVPTLRHVDTEVLRGGAVHPVSYVIQNLGAGSAYCSRYCRFETYSLRGVPEGAAEVHVRVLGSDPFELGGNQRLVVRCDAVADWAEPVLSDLVQPPLASDPVLFAEAIVWLDDAGRSYRWSEGGKTPPWKKSRWQFWKTPPRWAQWPKT
jgi:hypothetical protein